MVITFPSFFIITTFSLCHPFPLDWSHAFLNTFALLVLGYFLRSALVVAFVLVLTLLFTQSSSESLPRSRESSITCQHLQLFASVHLRSHLIARATSLKLHLVFRLSDRFRMEPTPSFTVCSRAVGLHLSLSGIPRASTRVAAS